MATQRFDPRPDHDDTGLLPGWALAGAATTMLAIGLEFAGSAWGDSPTTSYPSWLVPIAWPTALRVLGWLAAAAGTVAMNLGIAQTTGRSRRVVTVIVATPFVVFALGIALGAQWATWH